MQKKVMAAYNILILAPLALLGVIMVLGFIISRIRKQPFFGKPPIDLFFYYSGKVAMFITWGFMITKAIDPLFGDIKTPLALNWAAASLTCLGTVITLTAIFTMGKSIRVGLPKEETHLCSRGIFRFSRNPLYVGVFLITIASGMYFPETGNIGLALYAIGVHHAIILNEEKFLEKQFGEDYNAYRKRVRRYI
ncbi:MAG: isoprenylcysteine carboxylmethyltransferase family protein [Bacteroidota bacterium]|nr:isoprenylcysteine carboxylmethyltransferase family protein [Bacteroidota bacterium]